MNLAVSYVTCNSALVRRIIAALSYRYVLLITCTVLVVTRPIEPQLRLSSSCVSNSE